MGRQMGIFRSFARDGAPSYLASCIACCGPAADSRGRHADFLRIGLVGRSAEPFGLFASPVSGGGCARKMAGRPAQARRRAGATGAVRGDRERCVSPAALRLLAIVDKEGPRGTCPPRRDQSRHQPRDPADERSGPIRLRSTCGVRRWSPSHGAGDCEDYAIAKFAALQLAGISPDDLRIVIMHDTISGEDHAVAAARLDGHWLTLDNRRMAMVEDGSAQLPADASSSIKTASGSRRCADAGC